MKMITMFLIGVMVLFSLSFISAEQTVKTVEYPIDYIAQTVAGNDYVKNIMIESPDGIAEILSLEIILKGDFQASTDVKGKTKIGGSLEDCSPFTWTTPNTDAPSYDITFDCTDLVEQYNWKGGIKEFGFRTDKIAQNIYGTLKMTYYNNPEGDFLEWNQEL